MGKLEVNTFIDQNLHTINANASSNAVYPPSNRPGMTDVREGEIVYRKRGNYPGDSRLFASTSMCGDGSEIAHLYPDEMDRDVLKAAILESIDIVGVSSTTYNHSTDARDQGFVTQIGGLTTVSVAPGKTYEYGQKIMAALPDDDPKWATKSSMGPDGQPMAKYALQAFPEDYTSPGNLLLTHLYHSIHDTNRYRQVMEPSGRFSVDKFLSFSRAEGDSAIASGILLVYFLQKMGYITTVAVNAPGKTPNYSPYEGTPDMPVLVRPMGISNDMTPEDFAIKLSEILGNQTPDLNGTLSPRDEIYGNSMRRAVLLQIFYNGKHRIFEFGAKSVSGQINSAMNKTRDIASGQVDKSTREGKFLDIQLNHYRKKIACELQALDSYSAKQLGFCISGAHRKKRINIALQK